MNQSAYYDIPVMCLCQQSLALRLPATRELPTGRATALPSASAGSAPAGLRKSPAPAARCSISGCPSAGRTYGYLPGEPRQSPLTQHCQMFGNTRLLHAKNWDDLADTLLARGLRLGTVLGLCRLSCPSAASAISAENVLGTAPPPRMSIWHLTAHKRLLGFAWEILLLKP